MLLGKASKSPAVNISGTQLPLYRLDKGFGYAFGIEAAPEGMRP